MSETATVTSKGQVTIPIVVRQRLGLKEGDRVAFVSQDGQTVLRLERGEKNPFADYVGKLGTFPNGVPEINAWLSDLRDEA